MRRSLLIPLCLLSGCNADRIAQLEKENRELRVNQESSNLDLQQKCANQAKQAFGTYLKSSLARPSDISIDHTNHYNAKVHKCFIEIWDNSVPAGAKYMPTVNRSVQDAFEGREYASYVWANPLGKLYSEVPPTVCTVTTLAGQEITCHSIEEFEKLIKPFMEQ